MLIGFAGKRTAGKSFAAETLIRLYGYEPAKFATALKKGIRHTFGLGFEHTDGRLKEVPCEELNNHTPREAMEAFGHLMRAKLGDDVWVKLWFYKNRFAMRHTNFVFDDVRYVNEAEAIQAHGGKIIMLNSEESDALPVLQSERELNYIKPDFFLFNKRDGEFLRAVEKLAERLTSPPHMESPIAESRITAG